VAVSVFEPPDSQIPQGLCGQRITFLKVTCTITGYQPTEAEVEEGYTSLGGDPVEVEKILSSYFACYGMLLNVAVHPQPPSRDADLAGYPRIIDFEPKTRDLYQAATESGEILSASSSKVATTKSLTHTESTETGLEASVGVEKGPVKIGGKATKKWGETTQDSFVTQAEAARERSEKEATVTSISQMYNLLSGYHAGTNRATFLMLPRPHTLQPTDFRTFIQGLRMIEGIQEFFLIVSHPAQDDGLCVEVWLDTAHFPEDAEVIPPQPKYDESQEDFIVTATASPSWKWSPECKNIESVPSGTHNIAAGWVIDRTKGDAGHPGVSEIANDSNSQANDSLSSYDYQAISDATVQVSGRICGDSWSNKTSEDYAQFNRTYRAHIRSEQPRPSQGLGSVSVDFLITHRSLCACYRVSEGCPVPLPRPSRRKTVPKVVFENVLELPWAPLATRELPEPSPLPAMKSLLDQLHVALATSGRSRYRRAVGEGADFLSTDFVARRLGGRLSASAEGAERLKTIRGLAGAGLERARRMSLPELAEATGLTGASLLNTRRALLGLAPTDEAGPNEPSAR
jgi:hypothetical protein